MRRRLQAPRGPRTLPGSVLVPVLVRVLVLPLVLGAGPGTRPAGAAEPAGPDPRALLGAMDRAAAELTDYTLVLVREERFGDTLGPAETMLVKWARPQRIYVRFLEGPHEGREALFVAGRNRDRLKAHKGSFPDITLNLDPRGSWAMKGSHHPLDRASLPYLVRLVLDNLRRAEDRDEGTVRWLGGDRVDGRPCDRIELTSPTGHEQRTLGPGQTLWDLAEASGQPMHGILHYNRARGWKRPDDPRPGDVVLVPRYTASRVELCVDRASHLPLEALIFDHDGGLYERYLHRELRVNPGLAASDFDPSNPDYDF